MTNIYVGFHDQRNSSRVLKPPGGGTSNIFGNEDEGNLISDLVSPHISSPRSEISQYRGSSIQDVLRSESITTTITTTQKNSVNCPVDYLDSPSTDHNESKVKVLKIEEQTLGPTETVANQETSVEMYGCSTIGDILSQEVVQEKIQEKKVKGQASHRVPPGGYSSGLW